MRYAIVIEQADKNYSAYVPDLPGCIATGHTLEEVERQIQEAIKLHITSMCEDGLAIPKPSSRVEYVSVALWDSVVAEDSEIELAEAQKMQLDRRLAAFEIDQDAGSSWPSVKTQMSPETRRPMILTQHGRGVAILVDVGEFEAMQSRLEVLDEVYKAEAQITQGEGISHEDAKKLVRKRIKSWK